MNTKAISQFQLSVVLLIASGHFINDLIQAVVPALYPILKEHMNFSYTQLGIISFALNMVSSILQPVIGHISDKQSQPFALPIGMTFSLCGLIILGFANHFLVILLAVILIGFGSAMFHPEGSKVSYLSAGNRRGLAQSIYQVGGNSGSALSPLITILIIIPLHQKGTFLFIIPAIIGIVLLLQVAKWYRNNLSLLAAKKALSETPSGTAKKNAIWIIVLILLLIFARSWYITAISNYFQFFLMEKFNFSIKHAQVFLLVFLLTGIVATLLGGPLSDKYGKKQLIAFSFIGTIPFAMALPYLPKTLILIELAMIGFISMLTFSVMVVYVQDFFPNKVGTMAGLTTGFAFGIGAIGAIVLGKSADAIGIIRMIQFISFTPIVFLLSLLIPNQTRKTV